MYKVLVCLFIVITMILFYTLIVPLQEEESKKIIARAELFMKDLTALSPKVSDEDPDRSQAWPRNPIQFSYNRSTGKRNQYKRIQKISVSTDTTKDDAGTGKRYYVGLYGGTIQVGVDADSMSTISYFVDGILDETLSQDKPPKKFIPFDIAIDRGRAYLAAAGINTTGMVLGNAYILNSSRPITAESCRWCLMWYRTWRGIPYENQWVKIELDAGLGRLLMLVARMAECPPDSIHINITPEYALEIAKDFMAAQGKQVTGNLLVVLRIVEGQSAWLVKLKDKDNIVSVLVNTSTGEVLSRTEQ